MRRLELETKYFKLKTKDNLKAYKKQKNYSRFLWRTLNLPFVANNKKFWKVVKPLFYGKTSNEVALLEKDKVLKDENEVANELHSYLNSIVSSLGIRKNRYIIEKNVCSSELIDKGIMKFQFHPSILLIKSKINTSNSSSFREIETRDVDKAIRTLNSKKDDTQNDIPAKILKKCSSSTESIFQKLFNEPSRIGSFPDKLKLADIALVFKKNNTLEKENYRPVGVRPVVSKIF